jgi:hypothetical protein
LQPGNYLKTSPFKTKTLELNSRLELSTIKENVCFKNAQAFVLVMLQIFTTPALQVVRIYNTTKALVRFEYIVA